MSVWRNDCFQPAFNIPAERLNESVLPEILFISSYPPRECGIATYTEDLIIALNNSFSQSFKISICPLESGNDRHHYPDDIKYILNTDYPEAFISLASIINESHSIETVMIQHEFGLFSHCEADLINFLQLLKKPVVLVFHTVLSGPDEALMNKVQKIVNHCQSIIVMTKHSANILQQDYKVAPQRVTVIQHGTHLVPHADKNKLKRKYHLPGKKILSTFGLLSSGKNIETTLDALPLIVNKHPDVLFLVIGKTHPSVVKQEGEMYREMLEAKVEALKLQPYVKFINSFLPLPDLLEYLQLTDIYLFTSRDPNQTVSGTFSYAISCGCPIVSTPIPHALEVLKDDAGIIIDFENHEQLSEAVVRLLNDDCLRANIGSNGLHMMAATAWENSAIAHAEIFAEINKTHIPIKYNRPDIKLDHLQKMTTDIGIIQFSVMNQPDLSSGYTLDDNARALIAICQHYEITRDKTDLEPMKIYLNFIRYCLQKDGFFLNYVDEQNNFTAQNNTTNLEDANGRAIWALGFLISIGSILPNLLVTQAEKTLKIALTGIEKIHSTRAMAFIIKGIYYSLLKRPDADNEQTIRILADKLVQMYRHEADRTWLWFESYLTYANSILPEAMLCAWIITGEILYKEIAMASFGFLLVKTFNNNSIHVISNKTWMHKGDEHLPVIPGGEQPIDVAYTVMTLSKFYTVFKEQKYLDKMNQSFEWFLGNNHLHQIIYNPCTGGCYDGLEENYVNLNQGAESTVSYLMARLTVEKTQRISVRKPEYHNSRMYHA